MLSQEEAVEVRVLARQGKSVREIARELGIARNTVRRYLRGAETAYAPRKSRPTKLDPYADYVRERLAAARPDVIPATVLLRELAERGYTGGISQLKAFMAPLRQAPADPVVRFETPPGQQMQADFTTIRRGRDRLVAFVATLGFSRSTYVRFGDDESFPAWEAGLVGAFDYFGGVPQDVLFDSAKPVLLDRDVFGPGRHCWNPKMLELAEECAFTPWVCRPYRAKTKGKVERFNGYLKGSFVVPLAATLRTGGLVLDVNTANREVRRWLDDIANRRKHGTTQARPCDLLEQERQHLQPLPQNVFNRVLPPRPTTRVLPFPSIQHPLSVYGELMEVTA
ncbi:IS21 family transposase [Thermomonas fusca]